ncbi:ESX secretion-associated protein EspG [Nocardia sp. NPDC050710]|uniref:ESX secretion-associated protein EspG n=1 Tax=Nocardia sp. NPDC050710 TaxID=3157220 RepID=UPI0033D4D6F4
MNQTWEFTDLEFVVLWEGLKLGGLPFPFYFTTDIDDIDVYESRKIAAKEALRARLGWSFDEVLTALAEPDLKVVVNGRDGRIPRKPEGLIRLLAVRRGNSGYLLSSLPGKTYWSSGGFTVTECDPLRLADVVVAALPERESGRRSETVLPSTEGSEDLDYDYGQSTVHDSFADSYAERADSFLKAPATSLGTIDIVQGRSVFGPRGITQHRIGWRDLEEDGRYLIDDQNPPVASGIDRKRLIAAINTRVVAVVRAIKDERV